MGDRRISTREAENIMTMEIASLVKILADYGVETFFVAYLLWINYKKEQSNKQKEEKLYKVVDAVSDHIKSNNEDAKKRDQAIDEIRLDIKDLKERIIYIEGVERRRSED